jgi:hypothetical protein
MVNNLAFLHAHLLLRLSGNHDKEPALTVARQDLPCLHLKVVPTGSRVGRSEQVTSVCGIISREGRHSVDELQPRSLKPSQDLAESMRRLVRM